ncbi:MAG TPA: 50S ribosomal protein L28 [Gemmatimonadota bacterium]|nr:50S ribosomal protein L28 [Gemmatimonadota bacterium]
MARECYICGKAAQSGNTVSHANNKRRRRFEPNLQTVRAMVEGAPRRIQVCASCIRADRVVKAR